MGRGESRYALKSLHCEPGYLGLCLESLSDWCELKENFGWVSYWAGCYCRDRVKILISRILFTISKCSHAWLQHFLLETKAIEWVVCVLLYAVNILFNDVFTLLLAVWPTSIFQSLSCHFCASMYFQRTAC